MMETKTIIFDFDGTIIDSLDAVASVLNKIAAEKGRKVLNRDEIELLREKGPREILKELGIGLYQVPSLLIRVRRELMHIISHLPAQPGINEALYEIKKLGCKLAVISSNSEANVVAFLQKNSIDIFDFLFCGSSLFGKAAKLKKIVKDHNLTPEQVFYVGDEVRDIEAARKVRVKVFSATWGYNTANALKSHNPDYIIKSPKELPEIIKNLE